MVDEKSKRTKAFQPLPHFTKYAWQGGAELPDRELGWVLLNADGGHPGDDAEHAAIRRWVAPRDGAVGIAAVLEHSSDKGDGVRGRIVSSRTGTVGEWIAFNQKSQTPIERLEVRRGDTIDFVTDCRGSVGFDSFNWAPTIKYVFDSTKAPADQPKEWSAKTDFSGPTREKPPSLGAWEKYAQVILLANELVFVD
jgi:hypothetical protein